jgi:hypothetical protein
MSSQTSNDNKIVDRRTPLRQRGSDNNKALSASSNNAKTFPPDTYNQYMDLTKRVLQKSLQSFDTQTLIREAYGNEKMSVLGGSDMLQGIFDGLLDKLAKETVLQDFEEYFCGSSSNNHETTDDMTTIMTPKQQLQHIDHVIRLVLEWENRRSIVEAQDAESAQQSLDATLLPVGVSTDDVVHYREYQKQLEARHSLYDEVRRLEEEVATLQHEQDQTKQHIQEQLNRVQMVERQVEDAANSCSMVTN